MAGPGKKKIGEVLVEANILDPMQLDSALGHQRTWGGKLGHVLVERNFVSEDDLVDALSKQFGIPRIDLVTASIDPAALAAVPVAMAERLKAVPVRFEGSGRSAPLVVAMADPSDLQSIDDLGFKIGRRVEVMLASETDIDSAIRYHYRGDDYPERWRQAKAPRPARSVASAAASGVDAFEGSFEVFEKTPLGPPAEDWLLEVRTSGAPSAPVADDEADVVDLSEAEIEVLPSEEVDEVSELGWDDAQGDSMSTEQDDLMPTLEGGEVAAEEWAGELLEPPADARTVEDPLGAAEDPLSDPSAEFEDDWEISEFDFLDDGQKASTDADLLPESELMLDGPQVAVGAAAAPSGEDVGDLGDDLLADWSEADAADSLSADDLPTAGAAPAGRPEPEVEAWDLGGWAEEEPAEVLGDAEVFDAPEVIESGEDEGEAAWALAEAPEEVMSAESAHGRDELLGAGPLDMLAAVDDDALTSWDAAADPEAPAMPVEPTAADAPGWDLLDASADEDDAQATFDEASALPSEWGDEAASPDGDLRTETALDEAETFEEDAGAWTKDGALADGVEPDAWTGGESGEPDPSAAFELDEARSWSSGDTAESTSLEVDHSGEFLSDEGHQWADAGSDAEEPVVQAEATDDLQVDAAAEWSEVPSESTAHTPSTESTDLPAEPDDGAGEGWSTEGWSEVDWNSGTEEDAAPAEGGGWADDGLPEAEETTGAWTLDLEDEEWADAGEHAPEAQAQADEPSESGPEAEGLDEEPHELPPPPLPEHTVPDASTSMFGAAALLGAIGLQAAPEDESGEQAPAPVEVTPRVSEAERMDTMPPRVDFPAARRLATERTPTGGERGWALLGVEQPSAEEAVQLMGVLVERLVQSGLVDASDLAAALRRDEGEEPGR